METIASEIGEMDRISQLPDFILHHILSFFDTPAELVRMSVLSKTWFHLTASFRFLDFNIDKFTKGSQLLRQSFFKYVDYTASRFCRQNLTAHKFKLVTNLLDPAELDVVNRCLELVLKKGVKVLKIDITNSSESASTFGSAKYRLPNILLSVSALEVLTIRGCDLPSSFMVDDVKFKSLVTLKLENVCVDDEVIKYITTSCRLLEKIYIHNCNGFKSFYVHGHQNLQDVCIRYQTPFERIDIAAPNLSCLSVVDDHDRGVPRMNLASCKKLTSVSYFGHPLSNSNGFNDFLSNFPSIKCLLLATTYKCNNLRLSSHSLRTLLLPSVCDFEEIEFSTPNLVLLIFGYPCSPASIRPLVRHSTLQCYPDGYIDTLWFQKLRQFLYKKNGFKVFNLYINAEYSQKFKELEKLKAIELPPYELDHVELHLEAHEDSLAHIAFVDAVLWCCRPRSLTIRSSSPLTDFEEKSDVVKFTYEKLLEQEDQAHTNIQVVSPSSSRAEKYLRDLKSLSMALPCEGEAISFTKEEVLQDKAVSRRFADMQI